MKKRGPKKRRVEKPVVDEDDVHRSWLKKWLMENYTMKLETSLQSQLVYTHYTYSCSAESIHYVDHGAFFQIMKEVFPAVELKQLPGRRDKDGWEFSCLDILPSSEEYTSVVKGRKTTYKTASKESPPSSQLTNEKVSEEKSVKDVSTNTNTNEASCESSALCHQCQSVLSPKSTSAVSNSSPSSKRSEKSEKSHKFFLSIECIRKDLDLDEFIVSVRADSVLDICTSNSDKGSNATLTVKPKDSQTFLKEKSDCSPKISGPFACNASANITSNSDKDSNATLTVTSSTTQTLENENRDCYSRICEATDSYSSARSVGDSSKSVANLFRDSNVRCASSDVLHEKNSTDCSPTVSTMSTVTENQSDKSCSNDIDNQESTAPSCERDLTKIRDKRKERLFDLDSQSDSDTCFMTTIKQLPNINKIRIKKVKRKKAKKDKSRKHKKHSHESAELLHHETNLENAADVLTDCDNSMEPESNNVDAQLNERGNTPTLLDVEVPENSSSLRTADKNVTGVREASVSVATDNGQVHTNKDKESPRTPKTKQKLVTYPATSEPPELFTDDTESENQPENSGDDTSQDLELPNLQLAMTADLDSYFKVGKKRKHPEPNSSETLSHAAKRNPNIQEQNICHQESESNTSTAEGNDSSRIPDDGSPQNAENEKDSCLVPSPDMKWQSLPKKFKEEHWDMVLQWLEGEFEESSTSCLPRLVMYNHYLEMCKSRSLVPASQGVFGRMIFAKFKHLTMRRLGSRGNSQYCYMGLDVREESSCYDHISQHRVVCTFGKPKHSTFPQGSKTLH